MIVLGIDPGTAVTGYGVVVREGGGAVSLVECGVVRTDDSLELGARLRTIHEGILDIIARHRPARIAVEGVFYAKNVRTTVTLGHTRGVILLAAALRDVPVAEYSPAEIKNAVCGTGRATKEQVQFMVQQLLRLKAAPRPADAADGVAVALCDVQGDALRGVGRRASGVGEAGVGLRASGVGEVGVGRRASGVGEKGVGEKGIGHRASGVGRLLPASELPVARIVATDARRPKPDAR